MLYISSFVMSDCRLYKEAGAFPVTYGKAELTKFISSIHMEMKIGSVLQDELYPMSVSSGGTVALQVVFDPYRQAFRRGHSSSDHVDESAGSVRHLQVTRLMTRRRSRFWTIRISLVERREIFA